MEKKEVFDIVLPVKISKRQKIALKDFKERKGYTMGDIVRMALDQFFERQTVKVTK